LIFVGFFILDEGKQNHRKLAKALNQQP